MNDALFRIQEVNGVVWLSPDSVGSLKYGTVQAWCVHYVIISMGSALSSKPVHRKFTK